MTTPEITEPVVQPDEPIDLLAWLDSNRRWLTIATAAVVLGGAGWWIYNQSRTTKDLNAAKALFLARQSIGAGNPALAQSDLQKLASRYNGTAAGAEGAMLLAQLDYDQSKFQEGITVLENAGKSAPQPLESAIRALIGDGFLSMKNASGAAKEYAKAAEMTDHVLERSALRAKAARAYAAAGDTAKARQIWVELAEDPKNASVSAEAKVRLSEMTARPAKKE